MSDLPTNSFKIKLYDVEKYNTKLTIKLPFQERLGLNIYVSETQPTALSIVEGSIWIKRPNTQQMIYILDRIDTSEDFENTIIILTRDGFEEVNLYSGLGFTTLLSIRAVQYSDGEVVQILPYWIYRDGEWISNSTTLTQGVKIKIKNKTFNLESVDNLILDNIIQTYQLNCGTVDEENLSEILNMSLESLDNFTLAATNENIII
jgi:hypothetical protein